MRREVIKAMLFWMVAIGLVSCGGSESEAPAESKIESPKPAAEAEPAMAPEEDGASAETTPHRVRLSWRTETETNSFGYTVYRAESADGEMTPINLDAPIEAAGTTTTPQRYVYFDLDVAPDKTYYYKLELSELDGTRTLVGGEREPLAARSKPLSEREQQEIEMNGAAFRFPEP